MKNRQLEHDEIKPTPRRFPICLVLDGVSKPQNVGMIFRLAEAFGVERLLLCGATIAPPNVKVVKSARSTVERVPFEIFEKTTEALAQLRSDGCKLIGLEITAASVDLRHFDFQKLEKTALVVGSEQYGISAEALAQLDACVSIKLYGENSSLNVANAVAIGLFQSLSGVRE